jgi:transcriptional regulator with XRE-family HTH domain
VTESDRAALAEHLGRNICTCRLAAGLTQKELAEITGLERGTISEFETARRQPNAAGLWLLSCGLEIDIDQLAVGLRWVPAEGGGSFRFEDSGDEQ